MMFSYTQCLPPFVALRNVDDNNSCREHEI